uniref:Palmitoyltransferase n=1 Tax=Rhinolophus ferrumequinum TaxID=59479 RepID=A0A671FWA7_RHIFE
MKGSAQCIMWPIVPDTVPRIVTDVAPPRWSRVNGWSKPFDPFQVVVWAIFLTFVLAMFCVFIPMLPCEWQYVTYAVTSGGFVLHYIAYVTAMTIDPAEASVRCKIYGAPRPSFDRARQAHVIQDQYCSLCDAIVSMKAKHCRMCNKCVAGFDHHCKWMNNCVGSRNYWWFFVSIASAFTGLLGIIAIVMYILIQHFINPEALREDPHYGAISSQGTWLLFLPFFPVRTKTLVVVSIEMFVLLLASLCLVVITYLLFFHIYLRTYPPHWPVLCSQVSRVRWPFPTPLASASNQLQGERTNEHHERQLGKFYPETWGKHKRWKSCRLTRSGRNGIYEVGLGHHGKRTG